MMGQVCIFIAFDLAFEFRGENEKRPNVCPVLFRAKAGRVFGQRHRAIYRFRFLPGVQICTDHVHRFIFPFGLLSRHRGEGC